MSFYTSLNGSRRGSRPRTGTATANRQLIAANRATEKVEEARRLADVLQAILNLHRADFEQARLQQAPEPPVVDEGEIRRRHIKQAKASTSWFARKARRAALAAATGAACAEIADAKKARLEQLNAAQEALNQRWEALNVNDPDVVLSTLAAAFEDNEAAAAAVGLDGAEVTLVVVVPPVTALPERRPTTTAAGNLSLKKLTKREHADLYRLLVCGHVLVTVKEAFAVAPKITSARIVALRESARDAYGTVRPEAVLAARFERSGLIGIQWADADAARVVTDASSELMLVQKGAAQELIPIDTAKEPGLAAVVAAVDFEDLRG